MVVVHHFDDPTTVIRAADSDIRRHLRACRGQFRPDVCTPSCRPWPRRPTQFVCHAPLFVLDVNLYEPYDFVHLDCHRFARGRSSTQGLCAQRGGRAGNARVASARLARSSSLGARRCSSRRSCPSARPVFGETVAMASACDLDILARSTGDPLLVAWVLSVKR